MDRGLRAPLSPHEEVTLRRIVLGISTPQLLPTRDVAHLTRLGLVEENDGRLSVTARGRQRYDGLPRPAGLSDQQEFAAALRRRLQQARNS
jgi:hypothetical protein